MTDGPTPYLVGIAGGTGSGKSTLAFGLRDAHPGRVTVVHLDDYFFPPERVPKHGDMLNYDHPEALDFPRLARDLAELKAGRPVIINTKDHTSEGEYGTFSPREPEEFRPAPFVVLEGFLALWQPDVRKLLDLKVYLDAPFETHLERRVHFKKDGYVEGVLGPMHRQYVGPSQEHADLVIDVAERSPAEVLAAVEARLSETGVA